ncbi:MAG: hypothetical protein KDD76_06680 [Rickettsiales bacterium]|nr:hypothetical protein [Rickettsiales bacterium]
MKNICPVCGYPDLFEPAYMDDIIGSLEICPSCGYQYGKTDLDLGISHEEWRSQWIANGMKWQDDGGGGRNPPPYWNPKKQLQNIGVILSD